MHRAVLLACAYCLALAWAYGQESGTNKLPKSRAGGALSGASRSGKGEQAAAKEGNAANANAKDASADIATKTASSGGSSGQDKQAKAAEGNKAAEGKTSVANSAAKKQLPQRTPSVTPEREAAALSFVEQHHPELSALLERLKGQSPKEYQEAIMELFRTSERLARARDKDDPRYELDLKLWKAESRIRLLAARLMMDPQSTALADELRAVLREQVDLRLQRLEIERAQLKSRLEKIEAAIDHLQQQREAEVEKTFQQVLQTVQRSRAGRKVPEPKTGTARSTSGEATKSAEGAKAAPAIRPKDASKQSDGTKGGAEGEGGKATPQRN